MEAANHPGEIFIADPGDLTIEIIEYSDSKSRATGPGRGNDRHGSLEQAPTAKALVHVEKEKLMNSTHYFNNMFKKSWGENDSKVVSLKGDNIKSMEIWLRSFHLPPQSTPSSLPVDSSVTIAVVWHVIGASDKYKFDREKLAPWFAKWYAKYSQDIEDSIDLQRETLYPCYAFNHALGFQEITKELAYGDIGHIVERNPTGLRHVHLPPRVIQQINAAKCRLRNVIHNGLFTDDIPKAVERGIYSRGLHNIRYRHVYADIASIVRSATCRCKETTVFNYLCELQRVEVWPLVDSFKQSSINDLLDRMANFDGSNIHRNASTVPGAETTANAMSQTSPAPRDNACKRCSQNWEHVVLNAMDRAEAYFDGLCLDCMDRTKNIRFEGNEDDDYWRHG